MVIMPAFTIHVFFLWVSFSNISLVVQHNFASEFMFNPKHTVRHPYISKYGVYQLFVTSQILDVSPM